MPAAAPLMSKTHRGLAAAFLVVVAAVALIAVRLARPWTAALPGLVGGVLIGLTLRPRPTRGATPPGPADAPPPDASPPGHAGTPPPDGEAQGGGA